MEDAARFEQQVKRRIFYGWYIVGVGFLSNVASSFALASTLAIFLKPLTADLGVSRGVFSLLRSGEGIIGACLAPLIGTLVDRHGGARLMAVGTTLVGIGYLFLGHIDSFAQFVFIRLALVTVGDALMGASVVNIVIARWFVRHRGRALAIASMGVGFAKVCMFGAGISLLLFSLALVQKGSWREPAVSSTALFAVAALGVFIRLEKRVTFPLLDLKIFRIAAFTLGNIARWFSFITMSVSNLLMPFFLQLALGLDPLRAGLLVAPTPFAMALLAPLTGWLSERFSAERLCAVGLAVNGAALVLLALLQIDATAFEVTAGLALLGIGMGIFQTPNNNLLMSSVPRHRLGIGSSVLSIVRSLGYSIGATLAATIVGHFLVIATGETSLQSLSEAAGISGDTPTLAAFLRGYRWAYLTAAAIAFAGAAVSLWAVVDSKN